jgi:ATP-dependent Lon protease
MGLNIISCVKSNMMKDDEGGPTFKRYIFLVAQKDEKTEDPKNEDLHSVGTLATILQMLKLPDGTIKVLVINYFCCDFCSHNSVTPFKLSNLDR